MGTENVRHSESTSSPKRDGLPHAPASAGSAELEAALRRGDVRRAIALIDELFGESLFRFIRAMVHRHDLADDLYQTTLLQAFRDLETFAARSSLRTWLFGIARHRCLDALKVGKRRDGRFVADAPAADRAADDAPSPAQRLSDAEVVTALGRCLDELPAETRMILLMRFSESLPYEDIARVCRASVEAVRARVSRALPLLRRCIEQRGTL